MSETRETAPQADASVTEVEPIDSVPPVPEIGPDIGADKHGRAEDTELVDTVVLQKHRARVAELEKERDNLVAEVLRHCVAADKGVPVTLLTGATEEDLRAAADALLAFKEKPSGPVVHADGTSVTKTGVASDWLRHELSKK